MPASRAGLASRPKPGASIARPPTYRASAAKSGETTSPAPRRLRLRLPSPMAVEDEGAGAHPHGQVKKSSSAPSPSPRRSGRFPGALAGEQEGRSRMGETTRGLILRKKAAATTAAASRAAPRGRYITATRAREGRRAPLW